MEGFVECGWLLIWNWILLWEGIFYFKPGITKLRYEKDLGLIWLICWPIEIKWKQPDRVRFLRKLSQENPLIKLGEDERMVWRKIRKMGNLGVCWDFDKRNEIRGEDFFNSFGFIRFFVSLEKEEKEWIRERWERDNRKGWFGDPHSKFVEKIFIFFK